MTASYVTHIDLMTGLRRRSFERDIDPPTLAAMRDLLTRALAPDSPPLRWLGACDATLSVGHVAGKHCAMVRLRSGSGLLMATFGIARRSRCGAALWRDMHANHSGLLTSAAHVPDAPWMATISESTHPEITAYEAAIGWAFVLNV